ncbi:MFS transporter [Alicyclobacillus tolerans]|uniref:MFS transporter n=1 Tax=Alicyclobacillus tolerans TaxID=90970 RepID=UPI001F023845|nr:MFS transporter [Alicyclobacillus tolerans]MCF8567828.1 MFS transporter [Alicyclobacillus tolerans]
MLNESPTILPIHKRILVGTTLGWVFDFFDFVLFTSLIGPMAKELHFTAHQIGVALGISLLFTALGGIGMGYLADKIGRKTALIISIITYSLGTFLMIFTHSYAWMIFCRMVTGFGVGGSWGTGQTLIAETVPAKYRGRFGTIMHSGLSLGIIFAYLLAAFVTPHIGWRLTYLAGLVAALIVIPILVGVPESDVWLKRKEQGARTEKVPLSLLFKDKVGGYAILGLILITLDLTGYWLLTTWFPTYLQNQRHLSIAHSAAWLILLNVGGLIGYSSTGFISDRFGRRKVLAVYKVVEALAVLPVTLFWSGNTAILFVCMFFIGLGGGGVAVAGPMFNEIFPGPIRTTVSNSVFNIARGLQYYTPIVAAAWAVNIGFGKVLSMASIFFALMAIIIWLFPETRGKQIA